MGQVRDQIKVAAQFSEPVLVLGETGVGKELVAQQIHSRSPRSQARAGLQVVNCAGLSPDVLAAELFGHRRGAFTGADRDRSGRIRSADGSTMVLDEISEAPPSLQATVLRTVEYGEVQPVGSDFLFRVDVRFVATSNRTLTELGLSDAFRTDLLHRLAAFVIEIPPLRHRSADLDEIAAAYLATLADRYGRECELSVGGMALLHEHSFPGNVRELRQILLRAYAASTGGHIAPDAIAAAILPTDHEAAGISDIRPQTLSYRTFLNAFRAETGMSPSGFQRRALATVRAPAVEARTPYRRSA